MRPIAVTMGDPAGVGGELTLAAWNLRRDQDLPEFYAIDDVDRLRALASDLSLNIPIEEIKDPADTSHVFPAALPVVNRPLPEKPVPGELSNLNGKSVIESIELAVQHVQSGLAAAVVTNPIHKAALYDSGFKHPGHTEFLAALAGDGFQSVMMLACPQLRVVPITVHVSLSEAANSLSQEKIIETARITHTALQRDFGIENPRLAFAGLNPHAGENGAMGREELDIVAPALECLRNEGIQCLGPLSADTMFHQEAREQYDVAMCMYHDQALIPLKTLDFYGGTNITLGLPFIRTSPDHGTALNIAGQGIAHNGSFLNALKQARIMAANRTGEPS